MLYKRIVDVSVPDRVRLGSISDDCSGIVYERLKTAGFVRWPNHYPCVPVNMYLLERAAFLTGDSIIAVASKISVLVRYCFRKGSSAIRFDDLNDSDVKDLVEALQEGRLTRSNNGVKPSSNTIRSTMQEIFRFLFWYQSLFSIGGLLISTGVISRIRVEEKANSRTKRKYWVHRDLPAVQDSTDPKMPISVGVIEGIQEIIDKLYLRSSYNERFLRRFKGDDAFFDAYRQYISARRDIVMLLMRRTGLRPSEMAMMSFSDNSQSIKNGYLLLPTLKRRRLNPPLRKFPISEDVALRIGSYLSERKAWIDICSSRRPGFVAHDGLFLSVEIGKIGDRVSKSGLDRDFRNLCLQAGYGNQQTCFSMFRHRFITDLVVLHIKLLKNGKTQLSQQDYRMVLERVREKTGHKSIDSLWSYIDLAESMDGAWDEVSAAQAKIERLDEVFHNISLLRRALGSFAESNDIKGSELASLLEEAESLLSVYRLKASGDMDYVGE